LLESSPAPLDEVRQILADIRRDDLRASEVIRRLRSLLQKRETEMCPVDLNGAIAEACALVRAECGRRGVVVEARLSANVSVVRGDRVQLQQVLLNLLLNGMEAMADVSGVKKLTVLTRLVDKDSVEIAVTDTGPGIAPNLIRRLFDPFFTTKPEGTGLGLSISRSLVEAHDGRIWAESNPAGGATFRFTVPTGLQPAVNGSTDRQSEPLGSRK
jgi:signal transduction histidine kinase